MRAGEIEAIRAELYACRSELREALRWERSAFRLQYAALKLFLALRYRPDQPRVPAGQPEGGRWTTEGGGRGIAAPRSRENEASGSSETSGGSANTVRIADNNRRYSINLVEEEAPNGIGHTIRWHVDQTDAMLFARMRLEEVRIRAGNLEVINFPEAFGSFRSLIDANDLVNQTLRDHKQIVDEVAEGRLAVKTLEKRFGYITGKEAYRPAYETELYMRPTYSVRVRIEHDRRSSRGYYVRTSFPVNITPDKEAKMDTSILLHVIDEDNAMHTPPEFRKMGINFDPALRDSIPKEQDVIDFALADLSHAEKRIVKAFLLDVLANVRDPKALQEVWRHAGSRTLIPDDRHLRALLQEIVDRIK